MRILATAAFAFAAGVFSTQVLPEGGWLPLGLAALAAAVLCALLRRSAARPERKRRRVLLRAALIFGGAALGLLYTAGYRQVALAPSGPWTGGRCALKPWCGTGRSAGTMAAGRSP